MEIEMAKENEDQSPIVATPLLSKSLSLQNPEAESDADRFKQSLRELRDLRSQLHHAADYSESAFLKAAQKKILLANTKSYICEAIVTVIDHLGTVSANLEHRVHGNIKLSQTEQRIDCLKQRLLTCQQYALGLDLSTLQWSAKFPRHHRHYVSPWPQHLEKFNGDIRVDATDSKVSETTPCKKDRLMSPVGPRIFDASVTIKRAGENSGKSPVTHLISGTELAAAVPVFGGRPKLSKPCNPSFGSAAEDAFKQLRGSDQKKKAMQESNFLSFLRRSKRRA